MPETYSDPDFPGGGEVEFEGGQKPHLSQPGNTNQGRLDLKHLPNLKPNERAGVCEPYVGTACAKHIGKDFIYVTDGLSQAYIEQKLLSAFAVITQSPDLTQTCSNFAIPSICYSTFPPCDKRTEKPRKMCREECEVLEDQICKKELGIAKQHALLGRQMVLPDCKELPPIGSPETANCVRIGIPHTNQLILPHTCYNNLGKDYRGTISTSKSGAACLPWSRKGNLKISDHMELIGGHNYCRNPELDVQDGEDFSEPWCYSSLNPSQREPCGIYKCNQFNLYLYIAVPAIVALAIFGLCIGLCCMRKSRRSSKLVKGVSNPSQSCTNVLGDSQRLYQHCGQVGNMEMNSLLPPGSQASLHAAGSTKHLPQQRARAREFPLNCIRFIEELGEGAYGKVYKGECFGVNMGSGASLVAVKTLKPGATQKTKSDFQREAELMSELRHPNIVCLIGVSFQEDPHCMIFENTSHGDLHEFLIAHSPNVDSDMSDLSAHDSQQQQNSNVLKPVDMSFISIQVRKFSFP